MAVKVLVVSFVKAILGSVAPISRSNPDAAVNARTRLEELRRDIVFQWHRLLLTHPDPYQTASFLSWIGPHRNLSNDRRIRTIGQGGRQTTGFQIEDPAMIGTSDMAREIELAGNGRSIAGKRYAPVRTAILKRIDTVVVAHEG